MEAGRLQLSEDSPVRAIARACAAAGGRVLVVGGWVRDALRPGGGARSPAPTAFDLEVHGLAPEAVEQVLAAFGRVRVVGQSFPVFLVGRLPVEVGLPRRPRAPADDAGGDRWSGFDPDLSFEEASRGRDLCVNAMAWDPLSGELLDPHGGRDDLQQGRLRATDAARFGEDPLRGLRTAQLAARLELEPDAALVALCRATDLGAVPGERVFAELRKLLLYARRPSRGFELLRDMDLLRFFPELEALVGTPQDPRWHPEGDVFTHTLRVVDAAAALRTGDEDEDLVSMVAALCHDLGKPATTSEAPERVTAHGHSRASTGPTESLLRRLRAPNRLVTAVAALVLHHLAPRQFVRPGGPAGPRAYRRLARALRAAGVSFEQLARLARADHAGGAGGTGAQGDTTAFPEEALFLERARAVEREAGTHVDVVTGTHALARGVAAGPALGALLARCREIQDETGFTDAGRILDRALEEEGTSLERGSEVDEAPDSGQ